MNKYLKYGLIGILFLGIGCALFYYVSKPKKSQHLEHKKEFYTCSMHPEIIRDKPGSCPICRMTLIKKVGQNEAVDNTNIDNQLKPTDNFIVGHFETISPIDTVINSEIKLPGIIAYDPNSASNIATRVGGRIEQIYINYKYQKVTIGQKIFDLYSPELLTEQQNFIYLVANDSDNHLIINAAKDKLLRYGMTDNQIKMLINTKKTNPTISIFSPASGVIIGTESMTANVSNMVDVNSIKTEDLKVKAGDYIEKNKIIFKLLNTDNVWGIFNALQGDDNLIHINQSIKIFSELSSTDFIEARVNFVETQLSPSERTNRIRVYLNNHNLKYPIGLRLQGIIKTNPVSGLWIPKSAMVSIGNKKIVFLNNDNGFKATAIQTGYEMDNFIQVLRGITAADKIAKNAEYLVDSESFIKTE